MELDEESKAHLKAKQKEVEKVDEDENGKGLVVAKPNNNISITKGKSVVVYLDDNFVFPPGYRFCPHDDNFVFPPGYRFCPHDEELIVHYLKKKVSNEPLPHDKIKEVNLYKHTPQELSENYSMLGEKEWYFFTPRDRKYPNGDRPNRAAGTGYWKATGADKPITHNNVKVGFRKALVFYEGKPPKGAKTNWIMHEFRVNESRRLKTHASDMRLDDWILCRIYKKVEKCVPSEEYEKEDPNKVENCDYEDTIDSCGALARQHFELPQCNVTLDDPNDIMGCTKYSSECLSHGALSSYGMHFQPLFSHENVFWDHRGYQ
ncbi:hypothetical protein HAX54_001690 [Datura stramonium]|uniref:NAC domain-containing protein n=1 Tax=Datura stramonium TaxID=4076 RepID=A0ABS8T2S1_DATST|nr:hypothetical protein [Datura stramonium]